MICAVAMPLAPIAGPYAIWIEGACISDAAIAKLAADPNGRRWLQDIVDKVRPPATAASPAK